MINGLFLGNVGGGFVRAADVRKVLALMFYHLDVGCVYPDEHFYFRTRCCPTSEDAIGRLTRIHVVDWLRSGEVMLDYMLKRESSRVLQWKNIPLSPRLAATVYMVIGYSRRNRDHISSYQFRPALVVTHVLGLWRASFVIVASFVIIAPIFICLTTLRFIGR